MKLVERIALWIFSFVMLILSLFSCLFLFGWMDIDTIIELLKFIINSAFITNILLIINVIIMLLSIKCIFFPSKWKQDKDTKEGILLKNDDGELIISKTTIENLVTSVLNGFDSIQKAIIRVDLGKQNNVNIFVTLTVKENVIIKELTNNVQTRIKQKIKKTSDLEVEQVNVRVKEVETIDTNTLAGGSGN